MQDKHSTARRAPARLPRSMLAWVALAATVAVQSGCAFGEAAERPFVITSASTLGDLYWRGELTDRLGNRWNVWLLPGIAPTFEDAGEAWSDAGEFASDIFEGEFWSDRVDDVGDGLEFTFEDVLQDYMLEGLGDDFADTSEDLGELASETPFGWIPHMLGTALWGYVLKPTGRILTGVVGMAGGLVYAAGAPVAQVAARPVGAAVYAVGGGVVVPAVRLAIHQPLYVFAIANREPAVRHDGSFGLEIMDAAEAPTIEAPPAQPRIVVMTRKGLEARLQAYLIDQRVERDRRATEGVIDEERAAFEARTERALSTRPETPPIPAGARVRLDPGAQRYDRERLAQDLAVGLAQPAPRATRGASSPPPPPTDAEIQAALKRFRRLVLGER